MRRIAGVLVIALGAACAASRPHAEPPRAPVSAPVATPPPTDLAVVEASSFDENDIDEDDVDEHDVGEHDVAPSPPAEAPTDALGRARLRFEEGQLAFARGDFAAAIAAFTEADRLVPKAALMFNVAVARERLGDFGGARSAYGSALVRPDMDEDMRHLVHAAIVRIDRMLAGAR